MVIKTQERSRVDDVVTIDVQIQVTGQELATAPDGGSDGIALQIYREIGNALMRARKASK